MIASGALLSVINLIECNDRCAVQASGCAAPPKPHFGQQAGGAGFRERPESAVTSRGRRTPLPAPPSGSSPETPLHERGWQKGNEILGVCS